MAVNSPSIPRLLTLKTLPASQLKPGRPPEESKKVLKISFTDTGTGIKKEHLEQIYDPFFTTKPEDKGTGLGLSVCYSIIEKHGGILEAESNGKDGTTFVIELPLNQNSVNEVSMSPFIEL